MKNICTFVGGEQVDLQPILQKENATIEEYLHDLPQENPVLSLIIRKHRKHTYYHCRVRLQLARKILITNAGGHTVEEAVNRGFERLSKHLVKYQEEYLTKPHTNIYMQFGEPGEYEQFIFG